MSTQLDIDKEFRNATENFLYCRPNDWVTKLQNLCRTFWSYLDQGLEVPVIYVVTFIDLLEQEDIFEIARLVIPELRSESDFQLHSYHKREILRRTRYLRVDFARPRTGAPVLSEKDRLFRMEKELYAEVEVYRAGLIVYGSEALNSKQRRDVQERLTVGYEVVEKTDEAVKQSMAVGGSGEGSGMMGLRRDFGRMSQATPAYGKRKPKDGEESWSKKRKVGSMD